MYGKFRTAAKYVDLAIQCVLAVLRVCVGILIDLMEYEWERPKFLLRIIKRYEDRRRLDPKK